MKITINELSALLKTGGQVNFSFIRKDGTRSFGSGIYKGQALEATVSPMGLLYWDTNKDGWRTVHSDSEIHLIEKVTPEEFVKKMKSLVLKFEYIKNDSSVRVAFGTLDSNRIPNLKVDDEIKNRLFYYDLEKSGWGQINLQNPKNQTITVLEELDVPLNPKIKI